MDSLTTDSAKAGLRVGLKSDSIVIRGGKPLTGTVHVRGAKNLATKAMVAALLGETPSLLLDVPNISDVGVVTGMRATGTAREDFREVELDLMVSRPGGGQFPARETALIPVTSLQKVSPGSVVDAYYRPGDENTVAVLVSPG